MSLFIVGEAFPAAADFDAAKITIFAALLRPRSPERHFSGRLHRNQTSPRFS